MDAIFTKTDKDKAKVKHNKLWFKRATVDFPLTDEQYEIFKKGYAPDWDCRFEPVYMDGWFYITRSGFWLFKFKYEKKKDGLWHITANYDTKHTPGYSVMLNVIDSKPSECEICHSKTPEWACPTCGQGYKDRHLFAASESM